MVWRRFVSLGVLARETSGGREGERRYVAGRRRRGSRSAAGLCQRSNRLFAVACVGRSETKIFLLDEKGRASRYRFSPTCLVRKGKNFNYNKSYMH